MPTCREKDHATIRRYQRHEFSDIDGGSLEGGGDFGLASQHTKSLSQKIKMRGF